MNVQLSPPRPILLLALLPLILLHPGCAARKDVARAQTELADVRGNLQGLESNLEKRQMGMSEELLELKRSVAALKDRNEEFRQALVGVEQRLNIQKIETGENLRHLTDLNREFRKAQETGLETLSRTVNARLKEHEVGLADLRRQIEELHALETDQNRRLGDTVNRLNIFLDEATAESSRLAKGLADLTSSYNQLVDKINALNKEQVTLREQVKATLQASSERTHTVAEGETLSSIAQKYDVPLETLTRINGITNPNSVKVGQKLRLAE